MSKVCAVACAALTVHICLGASGATWYVDGSVSHVGDGQSWETAFKYIQTAVFYAASDGDTVIVAPGTYVEGVHFDGKNIVLRSTDPLDPDVVANTIIDGNEYASPIRFSGEENETCVLSGFTLQKGSPWGGHGAGICGGDEDNHTHATIRNNVITRNSAPLFGGGLAFCDGLIENNTITFNSAYDGGGLSDCGGVIQNNVIKSNTAEYKGGGLFDCDGMVQDNSITGNTASQGGGLAHCDGIVQGNVISGNSAGWVGGVGIGNCAILYNRIIQNSATENAGGIGGCDATIRSNVVAGNTAPRGAGLATCDGMILNNTITRNSATDTGGGFFYCKGAIANCIIWGNTAPADAQLSDSSVPIRSCIQDWASGGDGNITLDPRFVDPNGPDDSFSTYDDNDYHLLSDSPCVDAGTNSVLTPPGLDMDGNLRIARWKYPIVVYVDIGAYEHNSRPFAVTHFDFVTVPWPGGRRLVWNSQPNDTYSVSMRYVLQTSDWHDIGTVASQGETTSFTDRGLLIWNWRSVYYRVEMD